MRKKRPRPFRSYLALICVTPRTPATSLDTISILIVRDLSLVSVSCFTDSNKISNPVRHIIPATRIPAAESAINSPGMEIAAAMDISDKTEEKASDR